MGIKDYRPGHVVSALYLFLNQFDHGIEDPPANEHPLRPCLILGRGHVQSKSGGPDVEKLFLLPITHTKPKHNHYLAVPENVRIQAGLDDRQSYVLTDQLNRLDRFSFALEPTVIHGRAPIYEFGEVPSEFLCACKNEVIVAAKEKKFRMINRPLYGKQKEIGDMFEPS